MGDTWSKDPQAAVRRAGYDIAGLLPYALGLAAGTPAAVALAVGAGAGKATELEEEGTPKGTAAVAGAATGAAFWGAGELGGVVTKALSPMLAGLTDRLGETLAPEVLKSILEGGLKRAAGAIGGAAGLGAWTTGSTLTNYLAGDENAFHNFASQMVESVVTGGALGFAAKPAEVPAADVEPGSQEAPTGPQPGPDGSWIVKDANGNVTAARAQDGSWRVKGPDGWTVEAQPEYEAQVAAHEVQVRQAQVANQADTDHNALTALGQQFQESPLTRLSPGAAEGHAEQALAGSSMETATIPAEDFRAYLQNRNKDATAEAYKMGVASEYSTAIKTGTTFDIPTSTLIAHLSGTPDFAEFAKNVRFGDGKTLEELRQESETPTPATEGPQPPQRGQEGGQVSPEGQPGRPEPGPTLAERFTAAGIDPDMAAALGQRGDAALSAAYAEHGQDLFPGLKTPRYLETIQAAKRHATDTLTEKIQSKDMKQLEQDWIDKRTGLVREAAEKLAQQPAYQALQSMKAGQFKIDHADLVARYGPEAEALLPDYAVAKEGGLPVDFVAQNLSGYPTTDAFLRDLNGKPPLEQAAADWANAKMMRLHGDPYSDLLTVEQAHAIIHNDMSARALRMEFDHIADTDKTGLKGLIRHLAVRMPSEASIRNEAMGDIRGTKLSALRPAKYLAAEQKQRREAAIQFTKGDMDAAGEAKVKELKNHELYRIAQAAVEHLKVMDKFLRKFDGKAAGVRLGKAGEPYLKSVMYLRQLIGYGLPDRGEGRDIFDKFAADMAAEGHPLSLNAAVTGVSTPKAESTYAKFRGVYDAIRQINHMAAVQNRLTRMQTDAEFEALQQQVKEFSQSHFSDKNADKGALQDLNKVEISAAGLIAFEARPMSIIISADDNEANGPWFNAMWMPKMESQAAESARTDAFKTAIKEIFGKYSRSELATLDSKRIWVPEIGQYFTKSNMLLAVANFGNKGNRRYLQTTFAGIPVAEVIKAFAAHMDSRDFDVAQGMVDHLETYRPPIKKQELELRGIEPTWVPAEPFTVLTKDGDLRDVKGGYFPIVVDPARGAPQGEAKKEVKSLDDLVGQNYAQHMTEDGYTKERSKTEGRPLLLDLSAWTNAVKDVIHDLSFRKTCIDNKKILSDPTMRAALVRSVGRQKADELTKWNNRLATGLTYDPSGAAQLMKWARNNYTIVTLALKTAVPVKHLSMEMPAMRELGGEYWLRGVTHLANPLSFRVRLEGIRAASSYMAHVEDTGDSNLHELVNDEGLMFRPGSAVRVIEQILPGSSFGEKAAEAELVKRQIAGAYMVATRWVDTRTRAMTWYGAYTKALDGKISGIQAGDHDAAVAHGDRVAMEIKGAGGSGDVPSMLAGSEAERLAFMFMSMRNVSENQQAKGWQQTQKAWKHGGPLSGTGTLLSALLFTAALPAIWNEVMTHGFGKNKADRKKSMENIGVNLTEGQPGIYDAARYLAEYSQDKGAREPDMSIPVLELFKDFLNTGIFLHQKATHEKVQRFEIKSSVDAASVVTGLPGPAIFKALDALLEHRQESTGERLWRASFGPNPR